MNHLDTSALKAKPNCPIVLAVIGVLAPELGYNNYKY